MSNEAAAKAYWDALEFREVHLVDREKVSAAVKARIYGQDSVIDVMIEQARNGFAANPKYRQGPVGVFMLLGPPGTGKTSLAKALADALFENDKGGFYTVDMNSCRDEHSAWTYLGTPAGIVGGRGVLTTTIAARKKPMVILLDEFEKANFDVHRMFLSAWASGFLVDNKDGAQIDTRNIIWILTSNAATPHVQLCKKDFGHDRDEFNVQVRNVLERTPGEDKEHFPPEVLSRINEFFCLEQLVIKKDDNQAALNVGLQLVGNLLKELAVEYDLKLADEDIDGIALGETLKLLQTTFIKSGIRDLRIWLRRQLSTTLVDLYLSGVRRVRIVLAPDSTRSRLRLTAIPFG